ncbi:MAG: DNA-directed RNA polymerase subunit alpha [Phycisphaerae bacterium]|nr:DNA-directed RNA polymerase subunit alpha [Phycisphaerae bacterium]
MRIRWRGLELPTRVVRNEETSAPTYGRFVVEPFERGFGTTVGNGLRRILLSSLEGAAVTHVQIKGADHEFRTIPGVVEDVTEIILNVKSLIVRSTADEPKKMRVCVTGKKEETVEVLADHIEADAAIDVINKGQLLATLTDEVEFDMEMTVGRGRSYATSDDHKAEDGEQIIGRIAVDSVYSPVTRVRYRVEDTRVGQRTNYDRLIMEIWTNGTVTPEMALVEAAKILRKHLNPFVQYFELGSGLALEGTGEDSGERGADADRSLESKLAIPIGSLDLSVRADNCLASAEIATVGDLITWDEASLLKLRSFGKTSLREVKRKLADIGLSLRSDPESAPSEAGSHARRTGTTGSSAPRASSAPLDGADTDAGTLGPPPASRPPSSPTPSSLSAPAGVLPPLPLERRVSPPRAEEPVQPTEEPPASDEEPSSDSIVTDDSSENEEMSVTGDDAGESRANAGGPERLKQV